MGAVVVRGRRRVFSVVVAVSLVVGAVVGCSSPVVKPSGSTASPTVSASPSPDPSASAAAVKGEVLAVFHRYYDAVVAAQRGNPDPALFAGIAQGAFVEEALARARQFQTNGIVREGAPTFSNVTVTVDGESALVWACVDNSKWVIPGVESTFAPVQPGGVGLGKIDGSWVVTSVSRPPADFKC